MVSEYGRRDLTLDDKLGTTPAFSIHDVRSLPICAAICEQDDSCTSFFYNKMSRQCQGHDRSLDYTEHFEKCEGTKYYRMYEKSDVKPAGKRLSVFSGRNIPEGVLTEFHYVPSAAECLKECGVKPRCVSVYYNQRDRETCKMYLHVYLSGLQAYLIWPGSEFYRHNKSYCVEDPNYVNYPAVITCFKLYQISRSWGEAKLKCQTRNEQLIAIDTEEVENLVENTILNSGYSYMHYHIGIRRNDGGQYVSVNGDPILYSDWKDGKPQGDDNRRLCLFCAPVINVPGKLLAVTQSIRNIFVKKNFNHFTKICLQTLQELYVIYDVTNIGVQANFSWTPAAPCNLLHPERSPTIPGDVL